VPRRAARADHDALDVAKRLFVQAHLVQVHAAIFSGRSTNHRFTHGPGLFVNLLQHEVRIPGLLGHHWIPRHMLRFTRQRLAVEVAEHDSGLRDDRDLTIVQKHNFPRVAQDGRNVGCDEVLVLAEADDDGRTVADRDDRVGLVGGNQDQREQAAQALERAAHGRFQSVTVTFLLHEVRNDLGVRFGDEAVPFSRQFLLQFQVVLDDAVVHHHDAAAAVAMGMRVLFGRAVRASPSACGRCRTPLRSDPWPARHPGC
jgi:hypothetical protein